MAVVIAAAMVGCGRPAEPPNVVGEDADQAAANLEEAGFEWTFDPNRDPTGCTVSDQQEGDPIVLTLDCAQVDWQNHEGEGWSQFATGFSEGFDDGCDRLFRPSPNGTMYNAGTEYTVDDCTGLNPGEDGAAEADVPTEPPTDPHSEGYDLGIDAGCEALFENEGLDALYYGPAAYTADDCQGGAQAVPPARRPPPKPARPAPPSSCGTINFSGVPTELVILRGVDCKTARAVALAYEEGTAPRPWECFIGRQGDPEKLACGAGAGAGDVRRRPRAFIGR